MRFTFLICVTLILLVETVKCQNKKNQGNKAGEGGGKKGAAAGGQGTKSIGKMVCKKDGAPTLTGPLNDWMMKDCKPAAPQMSPADSSSMTPEAMEQMIMKPMGGMIKCILKKMGAMSKTGAPLRPKAVASFSSLFAGDKTRVQTAKTSVGKCLNQAGQAPKSDKDWASLSICILGFIETACLSKEQIDAMMKAQVAAMAASK